MEGYGKYIFNDGDYHEGIYKDDKKNGWGIMYYLNDKKRFEGEYKNDKKNGFGIFYDNINNNILKKGIFKDNNLII